MADWMGVHPERVMLAGAAMVLLAGLRQRGKRCERHGSKRMIYYRTKDGSGTDYGFSVEECGTGLRIYIESQPPYCGRDESLYATHRLCDGSRFCVCWTDPIETKNAALHIAAKWAGATQEYIRTGKRF